MKTVSRELLYSLVTNDGVVLDYVTHCLTAMRPHFDRVVVVANGKLNDEGARLLDNCCDLVIQNEAVQHFSQGHRVGLEQIGWDHLSGLDELTLMDSGLFGPVFPYEDMRDEMNTQDGLDFWALGEHAGSYDHDGYFQTCLMTFKAAVLGSSAFKSFWTSRTTSERAQDIQTSYEIELRGYFEQKGFGGDAYIRLDDYETDIPLLGGIRETLIKAKCPFVFIEPFCQSPVLQDENPANLSRIVPYIEANSTYPTKCFWQAVLSKTSLRTLHTNLAYQFTFDSENYVGPPQWDASLKIAVCAHIFYPDTFSEIYDRAKNIPHPYDFYITTASEDKKKVIEEKCANVGVQADVRVVGQNRGRDLAALFIDHKDVVLENDYDLICRLHSKMSPQVNRSIGRYFRNFIFDSVLATPDYASHVLDFFAKHPHVGMAFAPMIHTGYPSMGHAWFVNRDMFAEIMEDLDCTPPEEPYSPLSPFGSVFWFRPDALRPMFEENYEYSQYNEEPHHTDGSLAHGQERAMSYLAQARGYMSATIWPDFVAAQSTTFMEYKMDSLYSHIPQKMTASHRKLIRHMSRGPISKYLRELRAPGVLRRFEKRLRPGVKKLGAALGVDKSYKKTRM